MIDAMYDDMNQVKQPVQDSQPKQICEILYFVTIANRKAQCVLSVAPHRTFNTKCKMLFWRELGGFVDLSCCDSSEDSICSCSRIVCIY